MLVCLLNNIHCESTLKHTFPLYQNHLRDMLSNIQVLDAHLKVNQYS